MDWKNVNLSDGYEVNREFLDGYTFADVLLEVSCNIPIQERTPERIRREVLANIQRRTEEAIEIIDDNIDNITKFSIDYD